MGKGYDLENQLKHYFLNQGIFAFRLWTRQQKGELKKVDVIIFHPKYGIIFAQAKDRKGTLAERKYFDPATREGLLALATKYNGAVLKAWRDRGLKMEFLQSVVKKKKPKIRKYK